jgi:hypothetical protein
MEGKRIEVYWTINDELDVWWPAQVRLHRKNTIVVDYEPMPPYFPESAFAVHDMITNGLLRDFQSGVELKWRHVIDSDYQEQKEWKRTTKRCYNKHYARDTFKDPSIELKLFCVTCNGHTKRDNFSMRQKRVAVDSERYCLDHSTSSSFGQKAQTQNFQRG